MCGGNGGVGPRIFNLTEGEKEPPVTVGYWMVPTAPGNEWISTVWVPESPVAIRYALDGSQRPGNIAMHCMGPGVPGNN
jgi:hypothetical protein